MKGLPTGMQYFKEIIENNYLYVDKTEFVHKMVSTGKYYFLSRPRRFGKTLLVSTLEELFKGNKDLFKDLYIYDKWDWNNTYSIIHIDFSNISHESSEKLENSLNDFINAKARKNDIKLHNSELTNRFSELIEELAIKYNKKVVVLIDEYDKAIIKHLDDIELAKSNRNILSSFYQALKGNDAYLRFVFLTGVSKFSKTSIFSELNNLYDLTFSSSFSDICGYTQVELENYFKEYIESFARGNNVSNEYALKIIKDWYNGYSWDGLNSLYNPYSILLLFKNKAFDNYWFESGSPTFLIDLIINDTNNINTFLDSENKVIGSFPSFNLDNINLNTVLLQTGYLTIKNKKDAPFGELPEYTLTIPNREVHDSFYTHLLSYFSLKNPQFIKPMANDI